MVQNRCEHGYTRTSVVDSHWFQCASGAKLAGVPVGTLYIGWRSDTIPNTLPFKRSWEKSITLFSSKIQMNAAKLDFKIFPPFLDGTQSERVNTVILLTGGFCGFFFYVLYSSLLHLPPPQIPPCRRMLGSNPGLLRYF